MRGRSINASRARAASVLDVESATALGALLILSAMIQPSYRPGESHTAMKQVIGPLPEGPNVDPKVEACPSPTLLSKMLQAVPPNEDQT